MRYLIKIIFNVKLAFNAQTQAVQAGKIFSVHITQQREIPVSWVSLPGQHSPLGQLCSASQTAASEAPVLPFWRPAPERQETSRQGMLIVFISPCQARTCFSWFSDENPEAVMIITTQLVWKKKKKPNSAEIWSRDSPAPAIPCCAPSWQSSVPGTETQPEQASPSLWATIFLVSVLPFVFFYSYFHLLLNIPLKWHLLL